MASDFVALRPGGPLFRQAESFRLGTDSVLLADFVPVAGRKRGVDLGCGSGALTLLLLARSQSLHMTGLEVNAGAAETARANLTANALESRAEIVTGDLREHRALFGAGSFDLVVCNPPYYPAGSGALPGDAARAAARGELTATLAQVCEAAAWLCQTGGSVCLVHKPERLSELFAALSSRGVEPKRLRPVCRRAGDAPSLVLVEGRRGGRPGLRFEAPLVLQNADGSESAEYRRIYGRA